MEGGIRESEEASTVWEGERRMMGEREDRERAREGARRHRAVAVEAVTVQASFEALERSDELHRAWHPTECEGTR